MITMSENPIPLPQLKKPSRTAHKFSVFNALQTVISLAVVLATLFTMWTPTNLFSDQILNEMLLAVRTNEEPADPWPTITPSPKTRIGIVAGHWGYDVGAVCADGLTEEMVNLRIATLVQQYLIAEGFEVDLLKEFDDRLQLYQASALISIHNDSCEFINDEATGFKVAAAMASPFPERANRLTACLIQRYQSITGLKFHFNSITPHMTYYHAFDEIHSETTAAIIETGFLNLDRQILTEQPDLVAKGVTAGILCYVRNEPVTPQEAATDE
jgi:N-acetylmuramoyl-L-alanine amidase